MNTFLEIPEAKVVTAPTRGPPNPSEHILVVEDDVVICRFNAQVLAGSGYQVAAAEDAAAGWEALHANNFDFLITPASQRRSGTRK